MSKQSHLHHLLLAVALVPCTFPAFHSGIEDTVFLMLIILVIQLVAYPFYLVIHMDPVILGTAHKDICCLAFQYYTLVVRGIGKAFLQIRILHVLLFLFFPRLRHLPGIFRPAARIQLRKPFGEVLLRKLSDHLFDIAQFVNDLLFRFPLILSLGKMLPVIFQDLFLQFFSEFFQLFLQFLHIFQLRHGLIPPIPELTGLPHW